MNAPPEFPWQAHAERAQDEADALRKILTGLIKELRPYTKYTLVDYLIIKNALDTAEARLREVQGE